MLVRFGKFLLGLFVIVVAAYVINLVIPLLSVPDDIAHLAKIIIGLLALVTIVYMAYKMLSGSDPW